MSDKASSAKEKHPSWFKMKLERRELIRQLSPETAVNVLLACLEFLETGEKPASLSPIESVAFSAFMPDMDEAWKRYMQRVSNGAQGGRPKGEKPYGSVCPQAEPYGTEEETEEETETEIEIEVDSKKERGGKPPTPARKKFGEFGWIRLTEDEYAKLLSDLGQDELDRCIQYIDESAQSNGNKNRWKDWNLVLRRCAREGWGRRSTQTGEQYPDSYFMIDDSNKMNSLPGITCL